MCGIRIRTADAYKALKDKAETGTGISGRRARLRLSTEQKLRKRAVTKFHELGGWDIDGAVEPGHFGARGPGGGRTNVVAKLPEWRATTTQVAGGFWPWSVGATSPMLGTPLGIHLFTGADFGCDPMTYFLAGLISAPIAFVLALNGFGKSSLVRRMALGSIAQGHTNLFLGDIKPDFAGLTEEVGGQVITGGYGDQIINPLDLGALGRVVDELKERSQLAASLAERVRAMFDAAAWTPITEVYTDTERFSDVERELLLSAIRYELYPMLDGDEFDEVLPTSSLTVWDLVKALKVTAEQLMSTHYKVTEDVRSRQLLTVAGLIEISRGAAIADFEETLLSSALTELYRPESEGGRGCTGSNPPILSDLYTLIDDGNEVLYRDAAARTALEYKKVSVDLRRSLRALTSGRLGKVFDGQTTTRINIDAPAVCVDVSQVPQGDHKLKAALLLVCWSDGFGAVEAAHVKADAHMAPPRLFQVVIDELWQVIGSGAGIVARVDALVRLNRSLGTSLIMITHSVNDLRAFESEADAAKAIGFIEKAPLKFIGPVGPEELDRLGQIVELNAQERSLIVSASSTPPPSDSVLNRMRRRLRGGGAKVSSPPRPHGQGVFVAKFGAAGQPGIPFRLIFTPTERRGRVHDTQARFAHAQRDAA